MFLAIGITGSVLMGYAYNKYLNKRKKKNKLSFLRMEDKRKSRGKLSLNIPKNSKKTDIFQVEKEANQKLIISLSSFGLAVSSIVISPLLRLLAWLGFFYTSAGFFKVGYQSLFKERKINKAVVDVVMLSGIIAMGNLIVGTLMCSLLWLSIKLLLKTEDRSQKSLVNVFNQQPRSVWILRNGVEIEILFEELQAGETIIVNAGEIIAADGTIIRGTASINQHMLTGESQPAEKTVGDSVFAATLLLSGKVHINVEKAGTESVAAQISKVLSHTADFKSTTQARWLEFVDKRAPMTLSAGILALPLLGITSAVSLLYSFNFGNSMRIIAPATMLNFLNLASQSAVLIKDGRSLELLNKIDTVVFDKTGTLTLEQPTVGEIYPCNNYSPEALLSYAAAAEHRQNHPVAKAILQAAADRKLKLPNISAAHYNIGYGIKVRINEATIHVGSLRFMTNSGIAIPAEMDFIQQESHDNGHSLIMVAIDKQLMGMIELCPTIRPEAKSIIHELQQRNKSIYIITGDHEKPTIQLAKALGIRHYFAETLPEKKADIIAQLQKEGKSVCFIGDGINDSIALKRSNVSISMSGATTIATDTAQIVLMDGSLKQLITLFDMAKRYEENVKRSFLITLIPTTITVTGILFLHFGVATSVIFYYMGLAAGMGNAMLPMLKKQK
jgi:Cu2+-exporting ATPase